MRDDNSQQKFEHDEQSWHEHNRRILNAIVEVTDGMVKEGVAHKARMSEFGVSAGFEKIFTQPRR